MPLDQEERTRLAQELEFEILGLGPLELLVRDDTVSDILVNRFDQVYLERRGRWNTRRCGSRTMPISSKSSIRS